VEGGDCVVEETQRATEEFGSFGVVYKDNDLLCGERGGEKKEVQGREFD
jgi:hypothetical protein